MSLQLVTVVINIFLATMKFIVGVFAGSQALIADGFNSAGDVLATGMSWVAFRIGLTPPDDNHPYGHGNAEVLAGLLIGAMLCTTGMFIGTQGILGLIAPAALQVPRQEAMVAAVLTAVIKEGLYRASIRVGVATRSPTLLAAAQDHRADVICSLFVVVGVFIARHGAPWMDPATSILLGVYVTWLGLKPLRQNAAILMHEAPADLTNLARRLASETPGVVGVVRVRVMPVGSDHRVDLIISVSPSLSVQAAHDICDSLEKRLRVDIDSIREVDIHVEPADPVS